MTPARLHGSSVRAAASFKVPLLSWTSDVPLRFFRALYSAMNGILYIQPGDLVVNTGTSLGDVSASLRVFGSSSQLTLKAGELIADFPAVAPDRAAFCDSVILRAYGATIAEFEEIEIATVTAIGAYHLALPKEQKAETILAIGHSSLLDERAKSIEDAVLEPGVRFRIVGANGRWIAKVVVEKSEFAENGIFLHREISIFDLSGNETVQEQYDLIQQIGAKILDLIGVSVEDVSSDAN